jgi:hypothetical protein
MKNKFFSITDNKAAEILLLRTRTGFARANWMISELKKQNLPLWWDILWQGLTKGGDYMIKAYMERWAAKNFVNLDDMNQRNELRSKLSVLEDPMHKYQFPQRFLQRADDGSFSIDEEAIKQYCVEQCTYILTAEQKQAIDNIVSGLQTLRLNPEIVRRYFAMIDGKITIIGHEVYKLANSLASGLQDRKNIEEKFKAIRQVSGLSENEWYL